MIADRCRAAAVATLHKRDDLALPVPQLVAKFRRQYASWGVAPPPVAFDPDLDVLDREVWT
jgi:hypothetical protein